ncbi:MAG: DNA alkylation repair protein [Opitutales bacterium]|nr:DNA alkylation repair protein [Opitutales bacterium]
MNNRLSNLSMNEAKTILEQIKYLKPTTVPTFALRSLQIVPGGYGEGDVLYGVPVPVLRKIAKKHRSASLEIYEQLLQQPLHEARYTALVLLNENFPKKPKKVLEIYLRNTKSVNNWDLVDISAPHIVGKFCLQTGNNDVILNLVDKKNLWDNRIAVVATLPLIKSGQFALTLQLCERFLHHTHPLIHKACGWMLREISKRDAESVLHFFRKHCEAPSVMREYALECVKRTRD